MNELVIKTHDFEVAKKGLKEFSEQTTTDLDLKKVDTAKSIFQWFGGYLLGEGIGTDHKVTGGELNELTTQIQAHLIGINTTHKKIIQEFGQVYNALEALDKDYIRDILISIKATEVTSQGIANTQKEIVKIVDDQKKTLEVLKKFKQKLDNYAHLGDIDKMWRDCQKWNQEAKALSDLIDSVAFINNANERQIEGLQTALKIADDKVEDFGKKIDQQICQIESILAFTCELEKTVHLHDIDAMWSKVAIHSNELDRLTQQHENMLGLIHASQCHVDELLKYKENLCTIVHLNDVDGLWNSSKMHSNQLSELENQSVETNNLIQNNKNLTDQAIANAIEKINTENKMMARKIKYAYLIAGGSLGLALIELVVMLLKVI